MADDTLRLVAKVTDEFTGPLGKLKKDLAGVGEETKKQGGLWKKDWAGAREEAEKFRGVLSGFNPVLSAIGVGGFGAAMSLGGMAAALRGFTSSTRDLGLMAQQVGLTTNQLRTLSELGGKVGVSADTMKGAINQFAGNMVDLRQRWGQAYGELRNMNLGKLAEDLVNAPNMEAAIERAMEGLKDIPDPQKRARVSIMLFGTPDIGTVAANLGEPVKQALRKLQADLGEIDKETEARAKKFEERLNRLSRLGEKVKLGTLGPALEVIDKALDGADQNGIRGNEQAVEKDLTTRRDRKQARIDFLKEHGQGDPAAAEKVKRLTDEVSKLNEQLRLMREGGGSYQPMSFSGSGPLAGGNDSLIQKAAWGGFGGAGGSGSSIPAYGGPGGGSSGGPGGGGDAPSRGGARDTPDAPDIGGGMRGRPFGASRTAPEGTRGPSEPPGGYTGNDGRRASRSGMSAAGRQNVASWMEFFRKPTDQGGMGYTEEQARGQVAMMQGESGLNLNPAAMGDHDRAGTPHAFGTVQWSDAKGNDRFPRLRALAAEMGKDWRDRSVQQEMYRREMLGKYRGAYNRIRGTQTGEQSLWAGIQSYENPREHGLAYAIRRPFLNRLRRDAANPPGSGSDKSASTNPPLEGNGGFFPNGAPKVLKPKSMANDPKVPGVVLDRGVPVGVDGFRQMKPWTKAPAVPQPSERQADPERATDRQERASIDDVIMEVEAKERELQKSEGFSEFYKRKAYSRNGYFGHFWGKREDEIQDRTRDGSGDSRFGSAKDLEDELNDTHGRNAHERGSDGLTYEEYLERGVQDRKPRRSEFTPERPLSLDEIRKFRGPDRNVGDALMDRFYGKGAVGGGPGMQMPGGTAGAGKGKLDIHLHGFPQGTQTRASLDDLFKETSVSKGRSQMDMDRA